MILSTPPSLEPALANVTAKKRVRPTLSICIPLIWFFFTSTRSISSWLVGGRTGLTIDASAAGNPLDRSIMTFLIVLGLMVLGSRGTRVKRILAKNKRLVALFALIACSIVWSNFPDISIRRGIRSVGAFVMALVVLSEQNPLTAECALLGTVYSLHIPGSVIAIKYFRNFSVLYNWDGSEEEWAGLATDKNSLGEVAMCSGIFFMWRFLRNWHGTSLKKKLANAGPSAFLLGLSLYLLRGSKNSHSSTAIIGFIVCAGILAALQFVRERSARAKSIILKGLLVCAIPLTLVYVVFQAFDSTPVQMVVHATGRNMTFTDRNLIWADVIQNAAKSPILGVGIGAFWVGPIGYSMYPLPNWSRKTPYWRPEEAHNGLIDVYVQLGALGLILMVAVIGLGFAGALNDLERDFDYGSLRLVLLLSTIISNLTETSLLDGTHGLWVLFLLTAVDLPKLARGSQPGPINRAGSKGAPTRNRPTSQPDPQPWHFQPGEKWRYITHALSNLIFA